MLTLDEAIEHTEEKAKENCGECSENHKQLALWLNELKYYREIYGGWVFIE